MGNMTKAMYLLATTRRLNCAIEMIVSVQSSQQRGLLNSTLTPRLTENDIEDVSCQFAVNDCQVLAKSVLWRQLGDRLAHSDSSMSTLTCSR